MEDISKVTDLDGTTYKLKDADGRSLIDYILSILVDGDNINLALETGNATDEVLMVDSSEVLFVDMQTAVSLPQMITIVG